jgi:hypothetical protein
MLKQGSIVRARVADPRGGNEKVRPLVVITPTREISANEPLLGVAITGSFSDPLKGDEVPLPYHPSGATNSSLRKPCVAKCSWLAELNLSDVIEIKGFISNERLIGVLNTIASLEKEAGDDQS